MIALAALLAPPTIEQLVTAAEVAEFDVSPDGERVVFAWNRLGDWDLYAVSLRGGEPELLVGEPGHERAPHHSPDGARIAFEGLGENDATDLFVVPAAGGDAKNLTRDAARDRIVGWLDARRVVVRSDRVGAPALWAIDADSGRATRLLRGARVREAAIAQGGARVALVAEDRRGARLLWLEVAKGRTKKGPRIAEPRDRPSWLADGSRLLLALLDDGPARIGLWAPPGRAVARLPGGSADDRLPRAAPVGPRYAFLRFTGASVEVRVASIDDRDDRALPLPEGATRDVGFAPDGVTVVLNREDARTPRSLYAVGADARDAAAVRLLVRGAGLDPKSLAPAEHVTIPRSGRPPMDAWLYAPHPAHAGRAVIVLGGGPRARAGPGFDPAAQALVANGLTALVPAYTGCFGQGLDGERALDGRWPDAAADDLREAAAWLVHEAHAAPGRVGVLGRGWFGGYLALMAAARFPGVLRAVASVGGATDLWRAWDGADPEARADLESGIGRRARNEAAWLARSPANYVTSLGAVMLIHGAEDPALGSAQALAAAVERAGAAVKLVTFEGEGAPIERRRHMADALRQVCDFFTRRL